MDIKSKKCKVITAWAAFFLSICLLVESGLTGLNFLTGSGPRGVSVKDALASDFEETEEFRSFVSDYLDTFLAMAKRVCLQITIFIWSLQRVRRLYSKIRKL